MATPAGPAAERVGSPMRIPPIFPSQVNRSLPWFIIDNMLNYNTSTCCTKLEMYFLSPMIDCDNLCLITIVFPSGT